MQKHKKHCLFSFNLHLLLLQMTNPTQCQRAYSERPITNAALALSCAHDKVELQLHGGQGHRMRALVPSHAFSLIDFAA